MALNLNELIFNVAEVTDHYLEETKPVLENYNVIALRGLISTDNINTSLDLLRKKFKKSLDNPTIGEKPQDIQGNFQKLLVGTHNHSGLNLSRLFRTIYNPIWSEDIFKMHSIFKKMIKVRNYYCGLPSDFALKSIEANGLWSATRIHQYPTGGGYFEGHQDSVLTSVSKEKNTQFYQVILNMTESGKDFDQGGAYVMVGNEKVMFEENFKLGDIIIYNESTFHGVAEIDPHKNLDLDTFNGRVTAFVSLYKDMSQ